MSFDPLAAAIDWLDAYRAGNVDAIVEMHADDAVVECSCCVIETVTNKDRLRTFWARRFEDCSASDLSDLQQLANGVAVSYVAPGGEVSAIIEFAPDGKIKALRLGALPNPSPYAK